MRKATIDKVTNEVLNVTVVAAPLSIEATVVKRVIRPARPEARWTNKKTGEAIIKAAIPEKARHVLNAPSHGLRPTSGPLIPTGDLPPELEPVPYFVKVINEDDFLLTADINELPIEITPNQGGAVTLTEKGFDPGPGLELIDNDDTAQIGGKFDRGSGKFEAPPARPDIPDPAAERRAAIEAATTVAQLRAAILLPE